MRTSGVCTFNPFDSHYFLIGLLLKNFRHSLSRMRVYCGMARAWYYN